MPSRGLPEIGPDRELYHMPTASIDYYFAIIPGSEPDLESTVRRWGFDGAYLSYYAASSVNCSQGAHKHGLQHGLFTNWRLDGVVDCQRVFDEDRLLEKITTPPWRDDAVDQSAVRRWAVDEIDFSEASYVGEVPVVYMGESFAFRGYRRHGGEIWHGSVALIDPATRIVRLEGYYYMGIPVGVVTYRSRDGRIEKQLSREPPAEVPEIRTEPPWWPIPEPMPDTKPSG